MPHFPVLFLVQVTISLTVEFLEVLTCIWAAL